MSGDEILSTQQDSRSDRHGGSPRPPSWPCRSRQRESRNWPGTSVHPHPRASSHLHGNKRRVMDFRWFFGGASSTGNSDGVLLNDLEISRVMVHIQIGSDRMLGRPVDRHPVSGQKVPSPVCFVTLQPCGDDGFTRLFGHTEPASRPALRPVPRTCGRRSRQARSRLRREGMRGRPFHIDPDRQTGVYRWDSHAANRKGAYDQVR